MKRNRRIFAVSNFAFALALAFALAATLFALPHANAQAAAESIAKPVVHPAWTGVWQGKLDGVPSVELTLADDAGQVNGAIVFHAIGNDHGHAYSFSTEPHTLIHPRLDGNTLAFQVIRGNGSREVLNMSVQLLPDGNIAFTCSNCGPEGSRAELARMQ
jgi:hypothetical protein